MKQLELMYEYYDERSMFYTESQMAVIIAYQMEQFFTGEFENTEREVKCDLLNGQHFIIKVEEII